MLKYFILLLSVAFVSTAAVAEYDDDDFQLPAGTITCQIDSDDRDECIKEAIQDMLPKLTNGMASLNIPPVDPYTVERHSFHVSRNDGVHVSGTTRKVKVYGASKGVIQSVRTKITRNHISATMKSFFPESFVEGFYSGEGRFNNLKLKAKGYFNATSTNTTAIARTEGDIITVNGKEYLKLTKFEFIPQFGSLKVFATGLFPDPELNRVAIEFINQYWPILMPEMMPHMQAHLEPLLIDEANRFLLHVPLRKMLYYGNDQA